MMHSARTGPTMYAIRQPQNAATWLSTYSVTIVPRIAPAQYVPFTARSTRPRNLAGIISSIAELIAAYSPPMPMPAVGCHGGEAATDQVDAERDHEEVAASELVGQPSEEEGADDLADQVPPGDVADRAGGHVECVLERQVGPDVCGDGDLKAIEDPRDAERHH